MHTRNEAEGGDDQVTNTDFKEPVPRSSGFPIKTYLLKYNILVQIDAVEPNGERIKCANAAHKLVLSTRLTQYRGGTNTQRCRSTTSSGATRRSNGKTLREKLMSGRHSLEEGSA